MYIHIYIFLNFVFLLLLQLAYYYEPTLVVVDVQTGLFLFSMQASDVTTMDIDSSKLILARNKV